MVATPARAAPSDAVIVNATGCTARDANDRSAATGFDGLQPPGLGPSASGGLVAVYADHGLNGAGGSVRVSSR